MGAVVTEFAKGFAWTAGMVMGYYAGHAIVAKVAEAAKEAEAKKANA